MTEVFFEVAKSEGYVIFGKVLFRIFRRALSLFYIGSTPRGGRIATEHVELSRKFPPLYIGSTLPPGVNCYWTCWIIAQTSASKAKYSVFLQHLFSWNMLRHVYVSNMLDHHVQFTNIQINYFLRTGELNWCTIHRPKPRYIWAEFCLIGHLTAGLPVIVFESCIIFLEDQVVAICFLF